MFFSELFEFLPWFEVTILQEKEEQVLGFSFQTWGHFRYSRSKNVLKHLSIVVFKIFL